MRLIPIKDEKLKKILTERGEVLTEARKIQKEVEDLQKQQAKLGYKMERLKNKTSPIIKKHGKHISVGEYEIISRVFLDEKTKEPMVELVDQIEEYKKFLKENNDKRDNTEQKG